MQDIFSNTVTIAAPVALVKAWLLDPARLNAWNPEITAISPAQPIGRLHITRSGQALNREEDIQIIESDDLIIYASTGGRLAYRLTFQLTDSEDQTVIEEHLLVDGEAHPLLPLELLAPIAKKAFYDNLVRLSILAQADSPAGDDK
ncbi:SRPBCC family protein [Lacticaseibacillus mingshuiensis]|uniref:SRPBCC family protein n=1 Tax=Lacticaseibacillus mingshuiensis TaxID=2799574 RepID=UPI0019509F82|nr:SRPBCC family protein [Lacticaseibacillus mingshuiensis]